VNDRTQSQKQEDPLEDPNTEDPGSLWFQQALRCEQLQDWTGAHLAFYSAWRECPQEPRFLSGLTSFLEKRGLPERAFEAWSLGIQLYPENHDSRFQYADALNRHGRYHDARHLMAETLERFPGNLIATGILGNALCGLGRSQEAVDCYRAILRQSPDHPLARFNLGCLLLANRQWDEGWHLYESRLQLPGYHQLTSRGSAPRWNGEPLAGKRVLIYAEQGLGDTIQFVRYLPLIHQLGARIVFEIQSSLDFIGRHWTIPVGTITTRKSTGTPNREVVDFQIPLLSLPGLAHQHGWEPAAPPYLRYPDKKASRSLRLLESLKSPRIGISWQGNPTSAIDQGRSMDPFLLEPLLAIRNLDFVSLQARDGLASIPELIAGNPNFHALTDLDANTAPFEETLDLLSGLDLVITTDSALAHLAGALGKPVWLMLQRYPEWRWGHEGTTSDWYPSFQLYRQHRPGDWQSVIDRMKESLQSYTTSQTSTV
jgi:tetratricopeptide (TPR) repeat protein